ncbi:MAG: hypothetical protein A3E31_06470 [Candidatus Rokubacteria bacterium RIFCSPHIGHO2_12_FULL_73_22]|nr:MAG: hypothetical protein A3E31_06470 [Candidatus Rokubacteria bacterium RIFCSPHIGHO2_12_FULL_73_22]
MSFPTGLRALAHRDFRLFWSGQLVSLVGTWMQSVGQAWLVLQLTDSPFRLGLVSTLQFLPILLFSLVTGAVADRLPKRRLILGTQAALALQALTLAALVFTGHVRYWHVAVLAFLYGCGNVLDMPARQSFVVELAGREDLVNAIALNSAAFNTARIVGPAAAGLLIARVGVAPAFLLNGLSFLVVIGALLAVRAEGRPRPRPPGTVLAEAGAGGRYALATPRVAMVLGLVFVVSLCVFNFNVFVPLFARDALGAGATEFGFLMSAVGFGAVTGALALATLGGRRPPLAAIVTAAAIACAGLLALAPVDRFAAALPLLFVAGFGGIIAMASCNTTLQLGAPDELRGRVMGLYALMFGGSTPIGSFLVGSLAEVAGVRAALAAAGATGLVALAAISLWWRRRAPQT